MQNDEKYVVIGFNSPECTRMTKVFGPFSMQEASCVNGNIPNGVIMQMHAPRFELTCIGCDTVVAGLDLRWHKSFLCNACYLKLSKDVRDVWIEQTSDGRRAPDQQTVVRIREDVKRVGQSGNSHSCVMAAGRKK